jgi:membrane-associated protease RseP (regulator of RpoE activity)
VILLVELLALAFPITAIHVLAFEVAARALGVGVLEVSIGTGPTLFQHGYRRLRLIPITGYTKLFDSTETRALDERLCYDHQPVWKRVTIVLAGPVALVLVSVVIGWFTGRSGLHDVLAGTRQLIEGALHPLSVGSSYVEAAHQVARVGGVLALAGLLAAMVAAFNLLPIPLLNGGQAIVELFRPRNRDARYWTTLQQVSLVVLLALFAAWLVAFGAWLMSQPR